MTHRRQWMRLAVVFLAMLLIPVTVGVQSRDTRTSGASSGMAHGRWGRGQYPVFQLSIRSRPRTSTKLGAAWKSPKFDTSASTRAMPIVKNGVMFVTVPPFVYALNAKTGETIWRFQAGGGRGAAGGQVRLGSPAREGVALGEGLVFVGLSDARVIALNEKTGERRLEPLRRRQPQRQGSGHFRCAALRRRTRVGRPERRQRVARTGGRAESEDRRRGMALLRYSRRGREGTRDVAPE